VTQYFVRRAGRVEGPWTFERLLSEARQKKLSKFHEVSQDRQKWFRAEDVPELFVVKVLPQRVREPHPEVSAETNGPIPEVPDSPSQPRVWYIEKNGEPIGPFTSSEVREAWIAGRLDSDLAWREGFANWMRMAEVPEFDHWFRGGETGDTASRVRIDQSRDVKTKPPENQVTWFGISLVGLVFLVVLLAMVVATNSGSTLNKQHERDFFIQWKSDESAILNRIKSADQAKDVVGMLDGFKSLERNVRGYNTSKLKPELHDAIQQYADAISEVCIALKQHQAHNSDVVIFGEFLDAMVRISEGDSTGPLLDRLRAEQAVGRSLSDAFEKWERERFTLAARDPN